LAAVAAKPSMIALDDVPAGTIEGTLNARARETNEEGAHDRVPLAMTILPTPILTGVSTGVM